MNFDDQDWELGQPQREESRVMPTAWKVGAGFALGLALGGLLVHVLERQSAQEPARLDAGATVERMLRNAPPTAAGASSAVPGAASEHSAVTSSEPPSKITEAAHPASPAELAEPAASGEDAAAASATATLRAGRQAAERKARDWARFYKKPPQCDDNPNRDVMIECANHYIRAKRQFDEAYGAGKRAEAP
jgi:cytoskeletal protein RodZ